MAILNSGTSTTKSIETLTTPTEYIDYYFNGLREDLKSLNLNLSKSGVIGYFLHIMGNTQYDAKNYYDFLFNESFPINAVKLENLLFHSSLYNYSPSLALPAKISGTIAFDLGFLSPLPESSIFKQELLLTSMTLDVDGVPYRLNGEIQLISIIDENGTHYNSVANTADYKTGEHFTYPISSLSNIPLIGFYQTETKTELHEVPLYQFGNTYQVKIPISPLTADTLVKSQLSSISVSVNESDDPDTSNYIPYDVKTDKSFILATERSVYYTIIDNTVIIELGSGTFGRYIPNSKVRVVIETTFGEAGNIGTVNSENRSINGIDLTNVGIRNMEFTESLFNDNNELVSTSRKLKVQSNQVANVNILSGSGGVDILTGNKLRTALIDYIQSRNNLISEDDYYGIIKQNFDFYYTLFKKTTINENIIYLYTTLTTKDFLIPRTQTVDIPYSDFIANSRTTIDGRVINVFPETSLTTSNTQETFISPFVYVYDEPLNVWRARVYNQHKFSYPSSITRNPEFTDPFILPLLYLKLELHRDIDDNNITGNTLFSIKSTSSLAGIIINLNYNTPVTSTSPSINILSGMYLDTLDNTIRLYEQTGIYTDPLSISAEIYHPVTNGFQLAYTVGFSNVQVVYDVGDIVTLTRFQYTTLSTALNPTTVTTDSIIQVPVIHKDTFSEDEDFYLNQIISKFTNLNLSDNRLISDNPQVRFLNTNSIPASTVSLITKQSYNFDIEMPFRLNVKLLFDNKVILSEKIVIADELLNINREIAEHLQINKTTTDISFYKADIINLLQSKNHISSVRIELYDNNGTRIRKIQNGVSYFYEDEYDIHDIQDILKILDKNEMINYTPLLYHWDLNNIGLEYELI